MTKLQKREKSEFYLPVALRAGVPSKNMSNSSTHVSPFQKTHQRAVSTPRITQTQWPLIATSLPPSVAYPSSPHHDTRTCGANCTRCGKRKLIQLNSPPSKNIPSTAAPLLPIPQAHMRALSEGMVTKGPKRLSIMTTPAVLTPGKPPCCQRCGRQKRPASLPVQSSSKQVQVQLPSMQQRRPSKNYGVLRTHVSGTTTGTPHPNRPPMPSRSPSPPTPDRFYASANNEEHIISPLSPRRKVDFSIPSKSSSGASQTPYSPLSPSDTEIAEIGTGRLINLISNAIRETSPTASPPLPPAPTGPHKYTPITSRSTSVEAVVGLGLSLGESTEVSEDEDARRERLSKYRSPVDSRNPFEPIELDSVPIGDTTADILSSYADEKDFAGSRISILPLTSAHRDSTEETREWAEYGYDWTDAINVPVFRLPSVKEGISRFKSLRGGGSQPSVGRRPSVRERFGSMRGKQQYQQAGGWYGRGGSQYQALPSSLKVDVY